MTTSRRGLHPIEEAGGRCALCHRPLVRVDESVVFRPHWRHKPEGYRWGDRARALEQENRRLRDTLAARS